ncbi:MAG: hypothetical protein SGJ18_13410 [Pseudomonadota bacterium]|nr:hypothetical protein [Pseudomonadota bacterium]
MAIFFLGQKCHQGLNNPNITDDKFLDRDKNRDKKLMGTEVFLKFFVGHLETMILASAFVVVLLIIALVLLGLRESGPEAVSATGNSSDLEGLMRKMLDSAQFPKIPMSPILPITDDEALSAKTPVKSTVIREVDNSAIEGMRAELQTAKNTMTEKETLIAKLKSSLELAQSDQSKKNAPAQKMQEKIKELEAKLAEYEIIEDDIADLTMYKEENTQLKNQIKELMKNGGSSQTPSGAPLAPAAAVEVGISEDVLKEFKQAVDEQKGLVAPPEAEVVAPAVISKIAPATTSGIDDDLMSEFAAALADQKPPTKKISEVAGPIPTSIPVETEGPVTQDIMEEFMNVAEPEVEPSVLTEKPDTDKMEAELQSFEGSTQDGQANLDDIDTDKMLSEASELDKDSANQKS